MAEKVIVLYRPFLDQIWWKLYKVYTEIFFAHLESMLFLLNVTKASIAKGHKFIKAREQENLKSIF